MDEREEGGRKGRRVGKNEVVPRVRRRDVENRRNEKYRWWLGVPSGKVNYQSTKHSRYDIKRKTGSLTLKEDLLQVPTKKTTDNRRSSYTRVGRQYDHNIHYCEFVDLYGSNSSRSGRDNVGLRDETVPTLCGPWPWQGDPEWSTWDGTFVENWHETTHL